MLRDIDKGKMLIAISNWDENYNIGKKILLRTIVDSENPVEQLMNIWAEIFHRQSPREFIDLMVKSGIDGISKSKEDATYYVIYNRGILT